MYRYHKKVYFPQYSNKKLADYTGKLNGMPWQYSRHALDNLKYRTYNIKNILLYIQDLELDYIAIFEYYTDYNGNIIKSVYRIKYNAGVDLILVINKDKKLVTIYINTSDDKHITLDSSPYVKGDKSKNNDLTT